MKSPALASCALIVWSLMYRNDASAQEGTWSVSAVAGIALLQFDQVDEDGRRDIELFRELHATPIDNYPVLRIAPLVAGSAQYRFERDMSVSIFGGYQRAQSSTSFRDTTYWLSLDRRLTSATLGSDIIYHFQPFVGGVELSLFGGLAVLWGMADQVTRSDSSFKTGPLTEWRPTRDDYAQYKKSKIVVRVGGTLTVPFTSTTSLLAGATYQHAPLGSMSGTLREFDRVRPHETAVEFDYSTLQLTLGVLYSF